VRSMHGTVIETRELPSNTDLKREFLVAMLRWLDAGWRLGQFSSATATFFCDPPAGAGEPDRGPHAHRRMVSIDPTDPYDVPMYGGAHLGGCPHCGD
jgi:hypothetical protein